MPRILFTPIASDDLAEIWTYISAGSEDQIADHFLERIQAKCEIIAQSPLGFREMPELAPGVRVFPFGNYIIFYLVIDNGIEVLRVLHGSRDIEDLFGGGEGRQTV